MHNISRHRMSDHPANYTYLLKSNNEYKEAIGSPEVFFKTPGLQQHIEYIEKDHRGHASGTVQMKNIPNDPIFEKQWYLENTGELSFFSIQSMKDADINIIDAWNITTGSPEITVAILDTGINPDLIEFDGRLWNNKGEIPGNGLDDDNNGFIDDIYGWDFVNEDAHPVDDRGHGNAIAGVIGANANNTYAIAGIDQQCKLMICKVLDQDQTGFFSDWAAGIYYAVDNGANIINMSMTGDKDLNVLSDAIRYAAQRNVLVVCSMGNLNVDDLFYPAAYPSTMAVGSTDPDDKRSIAFSGSSTAGSNFGDHINLAAPGNAIYSLGLSNSTTIWSGTSMSTAVVSGVAALLLSTNHRLNADQVKTILYKTAADNIGDDEDTKGWDRFYGFGRIDAFKAISYTVENPVIQNPFNLSLFPNPVGSYQLNASILLTSLAPVRVQMINMQGVISYDQSFLPTSQSTTLEFDLEGHGIGLYLLIMEQEGNKSSRRFMITKP
ncbi:S8 family serine peptidase [Fulvivirga sp. M361]|uniref:S8 family serine peptidase n=1 Tax=Fulvivirga sp. M361 TaxID=2594266 RepID=UPI001624912A|nr:S8 family serine peptidase [Fulvivirga sp. M361]